MSILYHGQWCVSFCWLVGIENWTAKSPKYPTRASLNNVITIRTNSDKKDFRQEFFRVWRCSWVLYVNGLNYSNSKSINITQQNKYFVISWKDRSQTELCQRKTVQIKLNRLRRPCVGPPPNHCSWIRTISKHFTTTPTMNYFPRNEMCIWFNSNSVCKSN